MIEETLEEAAIRLYPDNIIKLGNETSYNAALLKRKDFIDGGNWVKERSYSEEDIDCLLDYIRDNAIETNQGWQINGIVYTNKELLEQFKKK